MDVIEFYMGALEEALGEYDREVREHPAGSFGSEATFLADKVVEAARAVLTAWDEENQPFTPPDPFNYTEENA